MSRYTIFLAVAGVLLIGGFLSLLQGEPTQFMFENQASSYELKAAGKTVQWAATQLAEQTGVPSEYLLFYRKNNAMFDGVSSANSQRNSELLSADAIFDSDDAINVFVRPVVGDHVHSIYSIWIQDDSSYRLVRPLFDDELEHRNPATGGETEYYFFKLHNGLHTHGKGLMHVHPWTSPLWFHETDGLGATLGNWFDDVGVTLRQPPYRKEFSLEFGNDIHFISNSDFREIISNVKASKTTKSFGGECFSDDEGCIKTIADKDGNSWKVLYWKHYLDFEQNKAPEIITEDIGKVWLGRNLGVVILVYGAEQDVVRNASDFATTITQATLRADITEVTEAKLTAMKSSQDYMNLRQFNSERYPSPQADDDRYENVDKHYETRGQEL